MKKNIEGITNNQDQKISMKALRRKKRQENVILENEKNSAMFSTIKENFFKYLPKVKLGK